MSQPEVLCRWTGRISSRFPHLSKPQALVLAVYSLGIALEPIPKPLRGDR